MATRQSVLWIEDSARLELRNLCGPVYLSGKYDFSLAEDVTAAVRQMSIKKFDALIVDVRLPPGTDPTWRKLYLDSSKKQVQAQLGLQLLRWMICKDLTIHSAPPPDWIDPNRIAVFSVESQEIRLTLDELGIEISATKTPGLKDNALLELIDRLMDHNSPNH